MVTTADWDDIRNEFGRRDWDGHHLVIAHRQAGKTTLAAEIVRRAVSEHQVCSPLADWSILFVRKLDDWPRYKERNYGTLVVDEFYWQPTPRALELGYVAPPPASCCVRAVVFCSPRSGEELTYLLDEGPMRGYRVWRVPLTEDHPRYAELVPMRRKMGEPDFRAQYGLLEG